MNLEMSIIRIPAILLALTVHEFAHGYTAYLRGDTTARDAGRLTFNPLSHLDLFGTIMMMFGPFGWAKPVPVNGQNLINPKRDMIYVAIAGPLANIILALAFGYFFNYLVSSGMYASIPQGVISFIRLSVMLNLGLSFFNLIPIPPLDGSHVIFGLLPQHRLGPYLKFVEYAPKVLLGMLLAEWMLNIPIFSSLIYPLWEPYFSFWQFVISI